MLFPKIRAPAREAVWEPWLCAAPGPAKAVPSPFPGANGVLGEGEARGEASACLGSVWLLNVNGKCSAMGLRGAKILFEPLTA